MEKKSFNGEKLKKQRLKLGLSQLELANEVNRKYERAIIDVRTISRWESNKNAVPRNNKITKVAEILKTDVEEFYELVYENKCNLISLNVNRFCGPKDNKKGKEGYFLSIVRYVKEFIDKNEGLAILQEVPNEKLKCFSESFSEYVVLSKERDIKAKIYTIAIAKKDSGWNLIKEEESIFSKNRDFSNRIIEIEKDNIKIMGVHMPLGGKSEADNIDIKMFWKRVIKSIEKYDIVLGDFNAHIGEESTFRGELESIVKKGYKDLIEPDYVTFYPGMTTIDHVFIKNDIDSCECKVIPKNFSDHVAIEVNAMINI